MSKTKKTTTYCFKRWTRNGYGMFSSLHKVVKIGVVTFSCTLVQEKYQPVLAQIENRDSISDVELEEVEVVSERTRTLSVTEKRELSKLPFKSIEDALKTVPGIDIRQRGADGVQSDISINGGSFDQVLILLNGVNITDPQTGHHNMNLPVDLSQIQKIEVLSGSGARMSGTYAFSGVINIITTDNNSLNEGLKGNISQIFGKHNFSSTSAGLSFNRSKFSSNLSASYKKSDGYIKNTDFDIGNFLINLGFKTGIIGDFHFQSGFQTKDFGANSFYSFAYPNQYESTSTLFNALNWELKKGKTTLQSGLYQRIHRDKFELFRGNLDAPAWYTGPNRHKTYTQGANFRISAPYKNGKTITGFEYRDENILSNVIGDQLDYSHDIYNKGKNRKNFNLFADQTFFLNNFLFSAGVNANYNTDYNFYWHGGSEVSYSFKRNSRIHAGIGRSVRLPTFTDLYYKSATQISNPNLNPEKSVNLELGYNFETKKMLSSVNIWKRWGRNMIDWVKYPDSTKWESKNITGVNAVGLNFTIKYFPEIKPVESIEASYNTQHLNKQATGFDSKYALDYMKNKISFKAVFNVFKTDQFGSLKFSLNSGLYDREGTWTSFEDGLLKKYEIFTLTDSRISWQKKKLSLNIDLINISNTNYYDFGGLKQPGFDIRGGVKIEF